MRVKPIGLPDDQNRNTSPLSQFEQGLADRTELQQWVAGLSGEFGRGAGWWAEQRSLPKPGGCNGPTARTQQFVLGCETAKERLTPIERRGREVPWRDPRRGHPRREWLVVFAVGLAPMLVHWVAGVNVRVIYGAKDVAALANLR